MNKKIILASKSPRRQELLQMMGFDFEIILKEIDESFPDKLLPEEVAVFISNKKAQAYLDDTSLNLKTVITSDTIVCVDDKILGKPVDVNEAREMLKLLSNRDHKVITGVSVLKNGIINSFYDQTIVSVAELTDKEIDFYIENYKPFDKAGSYGIQEWFGLNKVSGIKGSYTNVMGLPTEKLYKYLTQ